MTEVKDENGRKERFYLFYDGESVRQGEKSTLCFLFLFSVSVLVLGAPNLPSPRCSARRAFKLNLRRNLHEIKKPENPDPKNYFDFGFRNSDVSSLFIENVG